MARILCVANQKGGVGKTTTAVNLAAGLAKAGSRTLLVDLDPQCNATTGLGERPADRHPLVSAFAAEGIAPQMLRAEPRIAARLPKLPRYRSPGPRPREPAATLEQYLASGMSAYDFVLIDCPPSLGQLTRTALASSNEVIMPIQCEYFAMEGLAQMIEVIRSVMDERPGRLQFGGIVLTMFDAALELTHEVEREVRDFFGEIVYFTVIPRDVAVSEAPSHGKSVLDYAPRSRGAFAYVELCMEVLERE